MQFVMFTACNSEREKVDGFRSDVERGCGSCRLSGPATTQNLNFRRVCTVRSNEGKKEYGVMYILSSKFDRLQIHLFSAQGEFSVLLVSYMVFEVGGEGEYRWVSGEVGWGLRGSGGVPLPLRRIRRSY